MAAHVNCFRCNSDSQMTCSIRDGISFLFFCLEFMDSAVLCTTTACVCVWEQAAVLIGCYHLTPLQKKSFRYTFKFQGRVSGIYLGLASHCSLRTILVAVLWPSPALPFSSGFRSHRPTQLMGVTGGREVRHFSCFRPTGSFKVSYRKWDATSFASSSRFLFFMPGYWDVGRRMIFEPWRSGHSIVLGESLSFQFPSSAWIAAIPLVCAPRCLCSRSLACATSFPLPVQPMLIITSVFQTPLFSGGIFKNFQIHIRQNDSADGFSNNCYSV